MAGREIECAAIGKGVEQVERSYPLLELCLQGVIARRATAIGDLDIAEAGHGSAVLIARRTSANGGRQARCSLVVIGKNLQMRRLVADVGDVHQQPPWQLALHADVIALNVSRLEVGI